MSYNLDSSTCKLCSEPLITGRTSENTNSDNSYYNYGAINASYEHIGEKTDIPDYEILPYAEALQASVQNDMVSVETKILKPYSVILKLLGMRKFNGETFISNIFSLVWPFILFCCLISGYAINYEVCQYEQRATVDKHPVCNKSHVSRIYMDSICDSTVDSILPSIVHFIAFFYTFWIFRIKRSEQVEALVQKCFTTNFYGATYNGHKKQLTTKLKIYVIYGVISLLSLLVMTLLNSYFGKTLIVSNCEKNYHRSDVVKYLTGIGSAIPLFLMHITYFPILINYIIQSELISFLVRELRETLREKRMSLKSIMQEATDTSSFLHKMNHESSPAVSLMLFYLFYGLFIDARVIYWHSKGAGSFGNLFKKPDCSPSNECTIQMTIETYGKIALCSILLKNVVLGFLVFILLAEGCRVSMNFKQLVNQAMETRVFGFKSACYHELDSFHYYIKSLRMRAKLFQYPMETRRLLLPFVIFLYLILCAFMSWW